MFYIFVTSRNPTRLFPFKMKVRRECLADRVCLLFRRHGYNSWVEFIG